MWRAGILAEVHSNGDLYTDHLFYLVVLEGCKTGDKVWCVRCLTGHDSATLNQFERAFRDKHERPKGRGVKMDMAMTFGDRLFTTLCASEKEALRLRRKNAK